MTAKITKWFLAGFMLLFGLTLLLAPAARASPGDTLYVQSNIANLHDAPRADAPVVGHLNRGHKLKEFRREGLWVKVIIYGEIGKDGWVQSSDVGPQDPDAESTEALVPEPEEADVATRKTEPSATRAGPDPFILVVGGRGVMPGNFRASCEVITATGDKVRLKRSGVAPKTYSFDVRAVDCAVTKGSKMGRLVVDLKRGGRLLASHSTTRAYGWVQVRSKGPWGRALGMRCKLTQATIRSCIE